MTKPALETDAKETGAPQIEVTPEMIDAGVMASVLV